MLETQLQLNRLELKNNRAGYLPRFVGYVSYGATTGQSTFSNFVNTGNWFGVGVLGFKLEVPIFASMSKHYKSQQLKLNIQKTENSIEEFKNAVAFQGMQTMMSLKNNLETIKAQKENLTLSQSVLKTAQQKYKQGVGSNLEVINAETANKEAMTNYFTALYDLFLAQIDYE